MPPPRDAYELAKRYDSDSDQEPFRRSDDTPFRSSTSSDEEDIDEFDPLNYDEGTLKRKKPRSRHGRRSRSLRDPDYHASQPPWSWLRRCRIPSRTCCWIILLFVAAAVLLLSAGGIWAWRMAPPDGQSPSWYPTPLGGSDGNWAESYRKAAALVGQMTLVEKVNVTTGIGWMMGMCVGNTGPVPRLGFPSLCLQDGPLGIRFADNITAFPAGITVGATWNKELMYQRGRAHALEARQKGVNVLLGPAMGPLGRMPAGGRNWEGFGADPVLQGIAAAMTIKGIQDEGVIATAKHFVGNEQEHFRQAREWGTANAISSNIDDRSLHELYGWPFQDSIRAGVASIMCSYNQVNNSYACGNSKLMNGILKDEYGFQGFVQSDWLAQRSGVASALAGLDVTMPGDGLKWQDGESLWGPELTKAVLNTSIPMERLNDMATRVVAAWYQLGQDDKEKFSRDGPNFSSWTNDEIGLLHPGSDDTATGVVNEFKNVQGDHGHLVRRIAAEGTVLVKNEDGILPLSRKGWNVTASRRRDIDFRVGIFGEDARANQNGYNWCPDRGCNIGTLASGWGSGAVDFPYLVSPLKALREGFDNSSVQLSDWASNDIPDDKLDLVESQDLCIALINADSGEGYIAAEGIKGDRNDLWPQKWGDKLVSRVASSCGKGLSPTIVIIHAVGPVLLERWIDNPNIKAVLLAHLPGQESGNALADVLFGDVNPSGRLPYTIGRSEDDYGPGSKILTWPKSLVPQQNFTEGLFIDYRHFDAHNIVPRYEFGFGLSYTTFHLSALYIQPKRAKSMLPAPRPNPAQPPPAYDTEIPSPSSAVFPDGFRKLAKYIYPYITSVSDIEKGRYPYPPAYNTPAPLSPAGGAQGGNPDLYTVQATVSATLMNTGDRDGAAVVQLYVSHPKGYTDPETGEEVAFPVRVLRGFEKVEVSRNDQGQKVEFELTRRDLSYWDARRQNWVMPSEGQFEIQLGFSSRDIRLTGWL